jgi:hypothetical protein
MKKIHRNRGWNSMNKSTYRDKKTKTQKIQHGNNEAMTVKVFLKETDEKEKFKLLDHIFSCPECSAEFIILRDVWKKEKNQMDPELRQKLEQAKAAQVKSTAKKELRILKKERQSRKISLLRPMNIAAAATVLIALLLTVYVITHNQAEQIPLEREVGSEIFNTIEPEGAISDLPILFRWSPVQDAREYAIEVLDQGLEVIYRKKHILVPSFALPDKISSQLQVSKTYFWKVVATLQGEKSIESEMGKFYLASR